MNFRACLTILLPALTAMACTRRDGEHARLVIAATTSIEDTGLLDALIAEFRKTHADIGLSAVAVGTGQALALGRRGDADVLITHDSAAEMQLVADGVAIERRSLMNNDFLIAGPASDPAGARGTDALTALRSIARHGALFVSRGDDSGTHRRELALWQAAGVDPHGSAWYLVAGIGMGDALQLAAQKDAYLLTDRATYLRFRPQIGLAIICANDPPLINSYGVTVLKGARRESAQLFANWLTSRETQTFIGEFGRSDVGQRLFMPSALPRQP